MALAAAGGAPFSPEQVVNQAFYTIQRSGLYHDDVRDWKRKPAASKTWEALKKHFSQAYHELKDSLRTAGSAGYTANNMMQQDHIQALSNLANATAADKATMANLTETINNLTQ